MKYVIMALMLFFFNQTTQAQECGDPLMQGYQGELTLTVRDVTRFIISPMDATNNCEVRLRLKSGQLYFFNPDGTIVMAEKLNGPMDGPTKQKLIAKLKPGIKLMFDDLRFGDEGKQVPPVTINVVK